MADDNANETQLEKQDRQWRGALPNERVQALLDEVASLEARDQLELARTLFGNLPEPQRSQLLRELGTAGVH